MAKAKNSLSPLQQALAAALLAYSNMGQGMPEQRNIDWAMKHPSTNPAEVMCGFASHICESEEMLDAFCDEAKHWLKTVKGDSDADLQRFHLDVWKIVTSVSPDLESKIIAKAVR